MDNDCLIRAWCISRNDDLAKLKELLDKGINVNTRDANGRTLLHHAASNGRYEVVKCLLENGADVLVTDDNNNTALHVAVMKDDDAMIEVILENVARKKLKKLLNAKTKPDGNTALHIAAKCNCHYDVSNLLEYGANFESKNNAGKKPTDLTERNDLREIFKMIETSFSKAKTGDESLIGDLAKCMRNNTVDFMSAMNCTNNKGHTIMQTLIVCENYKIVTDLLYYRWCQPTDDAFLMLADPKNKDKVEKLAKMAREFREFWVEKRTAIEALTAEIQKLGRAQFKFVAEYAGKMGCLATEKAHEVLLAYRKFEGKQRTLTANPAMKTLEEVFEVLGFNPEELYVNIGEDACYYEKMPQKFKDNIGWLINLNNCIIDATISYLLRSIYTVQIFDAVKANDRDKVIDLLERGASVDSVDKTERTPLCHAVEKGNTEMVELLLTADAIVAYDGATSAVALAIDNDDAKVVKMLLDYVNKDEMFDFIDSNGKFGNTLLHAAAKKGNLDIVKTLLSYGATYRIFNEKQRTPLDLSTKKEVCDFLNLVDHCFDDAKQAKDALIDKLKVMKTDELLAVTGARNSDGQTLAIVTAKSGARNIAGTILKMIKEAKERTK